jgi:hypothetical protein
MVKAKHAKGINLNIFKHVGNMKKIVAKQFTLRWRDVFRGFIMAVLTPVIVIIQQSLEAGLIVFNWHMIGMAAVGGGFAYLVKNFLEPTKTIEKL